MNDRERALLKKRLDKLSLSIREQHRLPKGERDQKVIEEAKAHIATINKWLYGDEKERKKIMTKAEFKEQLVAAGIVTAPTHIMVIDDVETLEKSWPVALANNIQLQINQNKPAVVKRFKQLVREHKAKALKRR